MNENKKSVLVTGTPYQQRADQISAMLNTFVQNKATWADTVTYFIMQMNHAFKEGYQAHTNLITSWDDAYLQPNINILLGYEEHNGISAILQPKTETERAKERGELFKYAHQRCVFNGVNLETGETVNHELTEPENKSEFWPDNPTE